MDSNTFEIKMKEHQKTFNEFFDNVIRDVNEFHETNPEKTTYDLKNTDNFCDSMIECGGWVKDRINDTLKTEKPKKSLVRKLRKVLGYSYP